MSKRRKTNFKGKVGSDIQNQKQRAGGYGYLSLPEGIKVFKEEEDSNVKLDIIPYIVNEEVHLDRNDQEQIAVPGEIWYKRPFYIHHNIGSGDDKTKVVCLKTIGKPCPICEFRKKLMDGDADKKETDALRPSLRNLYLVIPIGHKDYEEELHIWDISQYCFQKLLNKAVSEEEDYEDFPNLEGGLTLKISFESESIGNSKKTTFSKAWNVKFLERAEDYGDSILDEAPELSEILKILSYDELFNKFNDIDSVETDARETEKYEEEEKPRKSKTVRKVKRDKEENLEPEPEKPSKRRVSRKPKQDEDEEPQQTTRRRKPASTKENEDDRCPNGFEFGVDTDQHKECATCDVWDDCIDEKEANDNQ